MRPKKVISASSALRLVIGSSPICQFNPSPQRSMQKEPLSSTLSSRPWVLSSSLKRSITRRAPLM